MTNTQTTETTAVIRTDNELWQQLLERGYLISPDTARFSAHWLHEGEARLDGGYYTDSVLAARRVVEDSKFETKKLSELVADVFILPRFRRIYASKSDAGWPYLSASEALTFRPMSDRWIAKEQAPKEADNHFAKHGWVLVSCSGSVGRLAIATKRLEHYFLTHDLARVVPNQLLPPGYLYAFLASWIGQTLLVKDQYGSAIKHLEPHHIEQIPIPLLPEAEQQAIHNEVMRAYALRDEANDLLDTADALLHQELGLPRFDLSLVPYLAPPAGLQTQGPPMPHPSAFAVNASALAERLDASYHVPVARSVVSHMQQGKYPLTRLKSTVKDIFIPPRFKRIYVSKDYGVAFLQGSHLPQMRPMDLKYLSSLQTKGIERWIIRKGWVLITCSGTIGRIGLVSSTQDKWAASQHLLRIIPEQNKAHPGYLAAILMTPYGQHQLTAKIYGGVIDELTEEDAGAIWIPDAPPELQIAIGQRVVTAFEKKDEATRIEEAAIARLEAILEQAVSSI